jgi:hypothetical protein
MRHIACNIDFVLRFTKAVALTYKDDYLAPSVIFAWLEEKQKWYFSVRRYPERDTSFVVANLGNVDFAECLYSVVHHTYTAQPSSEILAILKEIVEQSHESNSTTNQDGVGTQPATT